MRRHLLTKRAAKGLAKKTKQRSGDDDADPFAPKVKIEDDAPLGPEDIRVGDVVHVFGRSITVADADAATRAWLLSAAEADKKSPPPPSSNSSSAAAAASPFEGLPGEAIPVPEGDYEVAMRAAAAGARGLGRKREKMGAILFVFLVCFVFSHLDLLLDLKTQTLSLSLSLSRNNSSRAGQDPKIRRGHRGRLRGAPLG